jgi:methionine-rich copper-binding protein CopC
VRFPSRLALSLALLIVTLAWAAPAAAHAELESASPGPGDEVVGSPAVLVAVFSQDLDPSRSSLEIRDADGNQVAQGGVPGDGSRELRLDLPELEPGVYEVRWTSYSAQDGELERGSYTFTVVADASAAPTVGPTPTAGPDPDRGDSGAAVIVPIAAAVVVAAVVGLWLIRRRRA